MIQRHKNLVNMNAALMASAQGDWARAEEILRGLVTVNPGDFVVSYSFLGLFPSIRSGGLVWFLAIVSLCPLRVRSGKRTAHACFSFGAVGPEPVEGNVTSHTGMIASFFGEDESPLPSSGGGTSLISPVELGKPCFLSANGRPCRGSRLSAFGAPATQILLRFAVAFPPLSPTNQNCACHIFELEGRE